jgi:hypothetical protein
VEPYFASTVTGTGFSWTPEAVTEVSATTTLLIVRFGSGDACAAGVVTVIDPITASAATTAFQYFMKGNVAYNAELPKKYFWPASM